MSDLVLTLTVWSRETWAPSCLARWSDPAGPQATRVSSPYCAPA